jgi:hypothetical protein
MNLTTNKPISLKTGEVVPVGTPILRFVKESPSRCIISINGKEGQVRVTSARKAPSMATLERYDMDGICKSVGGKTVEPDGWDDNNTPSWLLAMGMI